MQYFLDDAAARKDFMPFSLTRHIGDLRAGIYTNRDRWEALLPGISWASENSEGVIKINALLIPTPETFRDILEAAEKNEPVHADNILKLSHPWDLFKYNDAIIKSDFEIITKGRTSASIPGSVKVTGDNIFIEESARLSHCIINTESGPVYIGKNAVVMEGCLLRGPLTVGDNASIKMGTKIYGATTIGPNCVAGGEIKNSILMGYSNKAHDGYLGDSVLGYWCNLGAGTSNSNVKNTGGEVRYTLSANGENISAGNKAGLLMGDYSRAAINTSFNTGSVVGPCCNIFGRHIPATYIPAFTWGKEKYRLDKAFRDIENWMQMKGKTLSAEEKNILEQLYKD